jgi:hypothetical protein
VSGWVPPRLRQLLGDDLDAIDAAQLGSLLGLVEDIDLEFKSEPWARSDGGTKEAAYDIAALANAAGGLVVVGVTEDGSGRATGLLGLDPSIDLSLWLHQTTAARIAPPPAVAHKSVEVDSGVVLLATIQPSSSAPHAVSVGDGALRYPVRVGSHRRYLSEAEVSDRYRRRMAATQELSHQMDELLAAVDLVVGTASEDRYAKAWLAVGLVPDVPGALELRRGMGLLHDRVTARVVRRPARQAG